MRRKQRVLLVIVSLIALATGVDRGLAQIVCCTESTGCGPVNFCSFFDNCAAFGNCFEIDCKPCTQGGNWNNFICDPDQYSTCADQPLFCQGHCGA